MGGSGQHPGLFIFQALKQSVTNGAADLLGHGTEQMELQFTPPARIPSNTLSNQGILSRNFIKSIVWGLDYTCKFASCLH